MKKSISVLLTLCLLVGVVSIPVNATTTKGPGGTSSISLLGSSSKWNSAVYWYAKPNTNWYYSFRGTLALSVNQKGGGTILETYPIGGPGIAGSALSGTQDFNFGGAGKYKITMSGNAFSVDGSVFVVLPGCYTIT